MPTLLAVLFVGAGGFVHLREWADTYRDVPSAVPGAAVVRVGFPVNAALSLLLGAALVATLVVARRLAPIVRVGALAFTVASAAALVISRNGSLLGWTETGWTRGASQTIAVEIGAVLALALAGLAALTPAGRAPSRPSSPRPATARAAR